MSINSLQPTLRGATGKELQFTGDFHAYWDQLGIPPGQFAERMVAWKALPQNAAWIDATEDADAAGVVEGLWRNGEQGVWYDASDLSTMFQDAAGMLPVYMPGQGQVDPPVGLLLDKRLGLARGPELLVNGEFTTDSGWTKNAGWGISGGAAVRVPDATVSTLTQNIALSGGKAYVVTYSISSISAGSVTPRLSGGTTVSGTARVSAGVYTEILFAAAGNTRLELYAAAITNTVIDSISVRELPGNHAYQATTTSHPTLSARYNLLMGTDALATQSVNVVAASYTLCFYGAGSVTLSGAAAGTYSAGSRSITCTAGSLTLTVSGGVNQADLRAANDGVGIPPYQRVVDANTYDTVGFPLYLRFDGVDDNLTIPSSASVFAFLHNGSGSSVHIGFSPSGGAVYHTLLSSGNLGSGTTVGFSVSQDDRTDGRLLNILNNGSGTLHVSQAAVGGISNARRVVSIVNAVGVHELRQGRTIVSPLAVETGSPSQAAASYDLMIGRAPQAGLPLAGRIFGVIIRGGTRGAAQIVAVEKFLSAKARVY